jgi:hypothetical protein
MCAKPLSDTLALSIENAFTCPYNGRPALLPERTSGGSHKDASATTRQVDRRIVWMSGLA